MIESEGAEYNSVEDDLSSEGVILYNGMEIKEDGREKTTRLLVAHILDNGKAEIIENLDASSDDDNNLVLRFETESFSDYLIDTGNTDTLEAIPSQIHVKDVIYLYEHSNYTVNTNRGVVSDNKINNNGDHIFLKAEKTGWFSITRPAWTEYIGNWPNQQKIEHPAYEKWIQVLPERNDTPPATIDTINNADIGLSLNLFDYDIDDSLDDYFNQFNHTADPYNNVFKNYGINNGHSFKFWGSGIGNWGANAGNSNNVKLLYNQYDAYGVAGIVKNQLNGGIGGYPELKDGEETLAYLFDPSANTSDRTVYEGADGLFKKDDDYYVYDSTQNYAWYNPSTNRFEVYNSTYEQKSSRETNTSTNGKSIGFFPFHKWDDEYDLYVNWNKHLNHHFGMSMSVDFSLPKEPKAVKDSKGNDIIFEFSGDDDLWVFIDGKLAMDIGGIHQPTAGTINFTTGIVTLKTGENLDNESTQMTQSAFNSRFPNIYDGEEHTLQVFYIERGGCDSNCKIKFNLTRYGNVEFDKVDETDSNEKLIGAVFGIYKDQNCTQPLMEILNSAHNNLSRAYIAESQANGHVSFSDIPLGTYYMKELHAPVGYPVDSTVHVVRVYLDQATGDVKVSIDNTDVGDGHNVLITNKKPDPIKLGLKKEWQNTSGLSIDAPHNVEATFEIKRIRTYETYEEQEIEGQGKDVSHLTVGWIHNGEEHIFEEFDLVVNSSTTVSWSYVNGYTGSKDCFLNGTRIDKDYVTGNIISQAFTMPAVGQETTFFIIDESENGEAIRNINVAGQEFFGNSGGGVVHTFTTVTEPDTSFSYSGEHVTANKVTLPIDSNTWEYDFEGLPTYGMGTVTVGGETREVAFNYSYYLEEVSSSSPNGTTVIYKDTGGNVINTPMDAETSQNGTLMIINQINPGSLEVTKIVTFNNVADTSEKTDGTYKFKITGISGTFTEGISHIIEITFANGKATGFKLDSTTTNVTGTNNSWSVFVGDLIPGDYIISEEDSGNLELEEITGGKNDGDLETKKVTVTVSPGKKTAAELENTAKASFKNNHSETEITIKKIDAVSGTAISGAKFSLKAGSAYADLTKLRITSLKDNSIVTPEDLTTLAGTIKVLNVPLEGIKIAGLPNGDYTLKEEMAPDGYVITDGGIAFTATDGSIGEEDAEAGFTFAVENEPGVALPNTGGSGTRLFTILGSILILGAGVLLWRRGRFI